MSSIFFSPVSSDKFSHVEFNPLTNNYAITSSAVKRTKKAASAVSEKTLFNTPISCTPTPFNSPENITEMYTPPFVNQLRSQKDPDTPRPIKIRSNVIFVTPLKL